MFVLFALKYQPMKRSHGQKLDVHFILKYCLIVNRVRTDRLKYDAYVITKIHTMRINEA